MSDKYHTVFKMFSLKVLTPVLFRNDKVTVGTPLLLLCSFVCIQLQSHFRNRSGGLVAEIEIV